MDPMVQGQAKGWALMGVMVWSAISVFYIIATTMRRKQQNEMQRHMLEKFASAKDFAEFVQSPVGQKYIMSFSDVTTSPTNAILGSVRTGVVLVFAGAGIAATVSAAHNAYLWGASSVEGKEVKNNPVFLLHLLTQSPAANCCGNLSLKISRADSL